LEDEMEFPGTRVSLVTQFFFGIRDFDLCLVMI